MSQAVSPTTAEFERMHAVYLEGGAKRAAAPQAVYVDASCPHADCAKHLQAIDFRLEASGRAVHGALVKAWWDDTGFAGRCPTCNRWIHFTVRGKHAISEAEAAKLPRLPENWANEAVIL
jgi:hypothetical protein